MFREIRKGKFLGYAAEAFEESGIAASCFTTKYGGVSSGIYESMNLRLNSSDSEKNVLTNFDIAASVIGVKREELVLPNQVHGDNIVSVGKSDRGNGIVFPNRFKSADALITGERGVALVTFFADCVPVFLLDTRKRVICTVHSGWRGTVSCIAEKAVLKMTSEYGCRPENIIAAVGPSIRECHYEVSDEIADIFRKEFSENTVSMYDKPHINMQLAIRIQLMRSGVPEKNITDSGMCTYCGHSLFFSHRYTGGKRGNMGGFLVLK